MFEVGKSSSSSYHGDSLAVWGGKPVQAMLSVEVELQPAYLLANIGSISAFQCTSAEKGVAETWSLVQSWTILRGGKWKPLCKMVWWRNNREITSGRLRVQAKDSLQQYTHLKKCCACCTEVVGCSSPWLKQQYLMRDLTPLLIYLLLLLSWRTLHSLHLLLLSLSFRAVLSNSP